MNEIWKTTGEKLLDKMLAFNESRGTSNIWMYHCRLGLQQDTCGHYERDSESRGAKQLLGGCVSCHFRAGANRATRNADLDSAREQVTP